MSRDLTDTEIAEALRKHPRTIQRWAAAGRLPGAHKAGRSWRIPVSGLSRVQAAAVRSSQSSALHEQVQQVSGLIPLLTGADTAIRAASERDCEEALAAVQRLRAELAGFGKSLTSRQRVAKRDRELQLRRAGRGREGG